MTAPALNATNLGCSITCTDLAASIRFYRDAIGFAVAQQFENEGKVVAAVIVAGNIQIVLNQDDGKLGWDRIKGQGCYLQINVPSYADVDGAAERIKANGGTLKLTGTPGGGLSVGFTLPIAKHPTSQLQSTEHQSTEHQASSHTPGPASTPSDSM